MSFVGDFPPNPQTAEDRYWDARRMREDQEAKSKARSSDTEPPKLRPCEWLGNFGWFHGFGHFSEGENKSSGWISNAETVAIVESADGCLTTTAVSSLRFTDRGVTEREGT